MVFTSHIFLFYFLPLVLLIYYLLPQRRNSLLTIASYVFYGWWEPWFVLLMMFSTVLDFFCGRIIGEPGASSRTRKIALVTAICGDLGLLAFFKYYTFTAENLNRLLSVFGAGNLPLLEVALPIGISFYTFESMSYTIDVYRGIVEPARRFSDISCFVSLFPHLVAGPIVRYNILAEQIKFRTHTLEKFTAGIAMFILGFAKKILLANPMGRVADAVFGAARAASPGCVGGGRRLRLPDLFRFLRLLGYGHRARAHVRLRDPGELPVALPGGEHHGFLAPLAHLAVHVAARLPVPAAGREPARARAHVREPRHRDAAGRAVARRGLAIRSLGRLPRRAIGFRTLAGEEEPLRDSAPLGPRGDDIRSGALLLGAVPLAHATPCNVLHGRHARRQRGLRRLHAAGGRDLFGSLCRRVRNLRRVVVPTPGGLRLGGER